MSNNKIPFTVTFLMWIGILIVLYGLAVIAFPDKVPGAKEISVWIKFLGIEIQTNSMGLAILTVGAFLSGAMAVKVPKGTMVLGEEGKKRSFTEKLARKIPFFAILIIAGVIYYFIKY